MLLRLAAVLVVLLGAATGVRADAKPVRQAAHLYRLVSASDATQADALGRRAGAQLEAALRLVPTDFRTLCERAQELTQATQQTATPAAISTLAAQVRLQRAALDAVVAQLDRAIGLDPRSPQLRLLRARALASWQEPDDVAHCRVQRKTAEAIATLQQLRAQDPLFDASQVAFQLGLLFTRSHAFEAAAEAYRRMIVLAFDARDTANAQANLGEVIMLAGDPAAALEHYAAAIALTDGGRDYALASIGYAVALDRLGEHAAALDKATAALESVGRSLAWLHGLDVFFEPDYELAYYEALGQEALARLVPETREFALEAAADHYRSFLARAEPDNPYRLNAQHDLAAIAQPQLP
jgi:tetratricopeptide (TPR) repeat protein